MHVSDEVIERAVEDLRDNYEFYDYELAELLLSLNDRGRDALDSYVATEDPQSAYAFMDQLCAQAEWGRTAPPCRLARATS